MRKKKGPASAEPTNTGTNISIKTRYCKSQAVKSLEQLADRANRERYPNTPPQWLAPKRYRDDTANGLTNCIIQFLRLKQHAASRINNTGIPVDTRKTFTDVLGNQRQIGSISWRKGNGQNGISDVISCINGRMLAIEIKHGKDRQSQAQRDYQQAVEKSGGVYFIARDFSSFYQWYNQTFCNE